MIDTRDNNERERQHYAVRKINAPKDFITTSRSGSGLLVRQHQTRSNLSLVDLAQHLLRTPSALTEPGNVVPLDYIEDSSFHLLVCGRMASCRNSTAGMIVMSEVSASLVGGLSKRPAGDFGFPNRAFLLFMSSFILFQCPSSVCVHICGLTGETR